MMRPPVEARMRLFVLSLVASLLACGGAAPSSSTSPSTHWRDDLSCHESEPSGQAACEARGCAWQAALFCSGIQQPPEEIEQYRRSAPCTCVCQADIVACMSMP